MTPLSLIAWGAMFLIVLMCARTALASSGLFSPASRSVVAICVAALSVLGLRNLFGGNDRLAGGPPETSPLLNAILLPYAVLALVLVVLLLSLAIVKVVRALRRDPRSLRRRSDSIRPGGRTTEGNIRRDG